MSKLTEAYIKRNIGYIRTLENTSFRYGDLGNCHSYVEFVATIDGKEWSKQLKMEDFFEFIGSSLLELDERTNSVN